MRRAQCVVRLGGKVIDVAIADAGDQAFVRALQRIERGRPFWPAHRPFAPDPGYARFPGRMRPRITACALLEWHSGPGLLMIEHWLDAPA